MLPSLRPARSVERTWLFDLHEAAMKAMVEATFGPWNREKQRLRFEQRSKELVEIIEVDGERVGAVHLTTGPDGSLEIGLIEVLPEHQSRGIGRQVLEILSRRAATEGRDLTLRVRKTNRARQLYQRAGFVTESESETHYLMRRR